MRNRGWILIIILALGLALVLWLTGDTVVGRREGETVEGQEEALYNAVMDRVGVTRLTETLDWMDMEAEELPYGETPVWVARGKTATLFHSVPACGGLKSPVRMTLQEALDAGNIPCSVCWVAE